MKQFIFTLMLMLAAACTSYAAAKTQANADTVATDTVAADTTMTQTAPAVINDYSCDDNDQESPIESIGGTLISIIALVGALFVPPLAMLALIWFVLRYRRDMRQKRFDLITKALDKGVELPADVFDRPRKTRLSTGITLVALALGIFVLFMCMGEFMIGIGIAAIPLFVGIGKLILYKAEK